MTPSGMDDDPVDVASIATRPTPSIDTQVSTPAQRSGWDAAELQKEIQRAQSDKYATPSQKADRVAILSAELRNGPPGGSGGANPSYTPPPYVPPTTAAVAASSGTRNEADPLVEARKVYNSMTTMVPEVMKAMGLAGQVQQQQATIQQEALTRASEAAANSARLSAENVIATDVKHKAILDAYGLDPTDPNSRISVMLRQQDQVAAAKDELRARLTTLQSTNFFENPFEYLKNIPEIQRTVTAHNALVDKQNEIGATIAQRQAENASSVALTPANSADLLRAKAASDGDQALANAQAQVATSKANQAAGAARNALDQLQVENHAFTSTEALASATERAFQADQRRLAKADKDEQEKAGESLAAYINLAMPAINGPGRAPVTAGDVKAMSAEDRDAWARAKISGTFGNGYEQSVPFIKKFGNPAGAIATGNASMMAVLQNIDRQSESDATDIQNKIKAAGGVVPPFKEAKLMALQQLTVRDETFARQGTDKSELALSKSPLAIDYDATLAAAAGKAAAGSPPQNAVIDALARYKALSPNRPLNGLTTDRQIIDAVTSSIVSGKVTPQKAAADVAEYYRAMTDDVRTRNGLAHFGIPKMTDYVISMEQGGKAKVDLMNSAKVEQYLTFKAVQSKNTWNNMSGSMFINPEIPQQ